MTARELKSLFLANRVALLRFFRARGAALDEAEDLLQDLFIKLEVQTTSSILEPRAYLYRMADNLFLDKRRSADRRARREEDWFAGPEVGRSRANAFDDALIVKDQLRFVAAALGTLPDRTVDVFRRFRIDGERQKVIAADLGISVSAVEKHLQRAYAVVLAAKARSDADNEVSGRLGEEGKAHVT